MRLRTLKELKEEISGTLAQIFQKSLDTGVRCLGIGEGQILPLYSKMVAKVTQEPTDQRASIMGKVMETIIKDKIIERLESNEVIKDSQYGCMKGRSCQSNLLVFFKVKTKELDEGNRVHVVHLDFAPPRLSVPDPLVTENEASELICNVDGYYPELISVWWLRDGVLQHDSQRNTTRRNEDGTFNTTSTYTLTPTDKDKNISYACRVNHTALMEPLQTKFTLEFKPEPSKVNIFLILFIPALVAVMIALGVLFRKEIRAVWMTKKPDGCAESDETVPEGEGSKTPLLEMAKSPAMSSVDGKKVLSPMMLFTSMVNYDPHLEDDGAEISCTFLANGKEILIKKNTPSIHILEKRSVSESDDCTPVNVPTKTKELSKKEKENVPEISMPPALFVGEEVSLTCSLKGSFPKGVKTKWIETLNVNKEKREFLEDDPDRTNYKVKSTWVTEKGEKEIISTLTFKPSVTDDRAEFTCEFISESGTEVAKSKRERCTVLARPEVSDIEEKYDEKATFTVNVNSFYPKDIKIKWYWNNMEQKDEFRYPDENLDNTFSIRKTWEIPKSEIQSGHKIRVDIEHKSMEATVTKEITATNPEKRSVSESDDRTPINVPTKTEELSKKEKENVPEISMPPALFVGKEVSLTCSLKGSFPKGVKTKWIEILNVNKEKREFLEDDPDRTNYKVKSTWVTEKGEKEIISTLTFKPSVTDDQAEFTCEFISESGTEVAKSKRERCTVLARPEVSDIEEKYDEKATFTVNVNSFYPKDIKIKWYWNNMEQKDEFRYPDVNLDNTFSIRKTWEIPKSEIQSGHKIRVDIEHKSMEATVTKKITATNPEKRSVSESDDRTPINVPTKTEELSKKEKENVPEISMPSALFVGKEVSLTCSLKGSFPKGVKTKWIEILNVNKEKREFLEDDPDRTNYKVKSTWVTEKGEKEIISTLTFKPSVTDDQAEFTCEFISESGTEVAKSKRERCTVLARPEVSDIEEKYDEKATFTVNVNSFYPKDIKIKWYWNNMEQKDEFRYPDVNLDNTFSIRKTWEIPKSEIHSGHKIRVDIEHKSMEATVTKEITATNPDGQNSTS
ncbi:uncharacterized protein LOC102351135 [Latimeria chalumnae]|uniref:uncharacterized protein LOC102351135 n=1 Tax=Latimeria chalumnae TaxID=7897 RepID=UPI00313D68FB